MNRKWLTGLALASVAGTGGAAYVAVAAPSSGASAAAQAPALVPLTPTTGSTTGSTADGTTVAGASPARTFSYRIGDAGTVTVDVQGTALAGRRLDPAVGWSVLAMSSTGAHLDVQLTDSRRIVGFAADLVGPDVVVSVTNGEIAGEAATSTVGARAGSVADAAQVVAQTLPATPAPTTGASPVSGTAPSVRRAPSAAATTVTSSAGTRRDESGVEHDGDHEDDASAFGGGQDD